MKSFPKYNYEANKHLLVDGVNGRRLTLALFKETSATPHITPPFSLKEWRNTFVEIADPTGYRAMEVLIGDWEHWKLIITNQLIAQMYEEWVEEVETKLKSEGIASMRKLAASKDSAARSLVNGEWAPKKRGRPSQKKVEDSRHIDDAKRLELV